VKPDAARLRDYSAELQAAEPFVPPFLARFARGRKSLHFAAVLHQTGLDSPTFKTVEEAFRRADPQLVVLEGLPTRAGPSPASFCAYAEKHAADGFAREGEIVYAAHLCLARGTPFLGGEPGAAEVHEAMRRLGYSTKDLMAFELLRFIPVWRRRGTLEADDFSRQAEASLRDSAWFEAAGEERLTFAEFESWYGAHGDLNKPYLQAEEGDLAPLKSGNWFERLSAELGVLRDRSAVAAIAAALESADRVLAVYGGAHLAVARGALEAVFGPAIHDKPF
jgi:hypothetical protein